MRHTGFPAVSNRQAVVLVLGSLPGRRSLEVGEYYANARNAFWRMMGRLLGENLDLPYATRKRILKKKRIALWDVLAAAQRPGSLDTSIVGTSAVPNDFRIFLKSHPNIRMVCFNGRKAADLYRRKVLPTLSADFAEIR
ncbi:MAG: DNA-deoxyinosine glycosylase, partial [Candidatus Methylomirabilales bacterium]